MVQFVLYQNPIMTNSEFNKRESSGYNDSVYIDKLTLNSTWQLLRLKGLKKINVMDEFTPFQKVWRWLLKLRKIQVTIPSFIVEQLKMENNKSVIITSRKLAYNLAIKAAKQIVENDQELTRLNNTYGRNTLLLFISKYLPNIIEYWTVRAMASQVLCAGRRPNIWLKRPDRFDEVLLKEALPDLDIRFYSDTSSGIFKL